MTPRVPRHRFSRPRLVGLVAIAVVAMAVFVSYRALYGLPFSATYEISVDVPDAAHIAPAADVRVGGARVGQVQEATAMRDAGGRPFARLKVSLKNGVEVPRDSTFTVSPSSILGAKYLALRPGRDSRVITAGGVSPLRQARPAVELSDAFNLFDKPTTHGLRGVVTGLGDALVGRGGDLNATVGSLGEMLPPLTRVLTNLASHRVALGGLIDGAAATTSALTGVAPRLAPLLDHAARTLGAVDRPALGDAVRELPRAERVTTTTLGRLQPLLRDAAVLAGGLRAGTRDLPSTTRELSGALQTSTRVLAKTPASLADVPALFARLAQAGGPVRRALDQLTPAVRSVGTALDRLTPAQVHCNVGGLMVRNFASVFSDGDRYGSWARVVLVDLPLAQTLQEPKPAKNLHVNPYPRENAEECEAGNEPFGPGQMIGNPPGNQSRKVEATAPPPGVTELAQRAGIIPGGQR